VQRLPSHMAQRTGTVFFKILEEFPAVLNPSKVLPEVKHHVRDHIETEGHASAAQYRLLDPVKLEAARNKFLELQKQGIL